MKLKHVMKNIALVLKYYIKYVPGFFFGNLIFTVVVSAVWTLQGPLTTKYIFDSLMEGRPVKSIILFLLMVVGIVFFRHIFACYIVEYLTAVADTKIQENVLKELYEKASKMDLEYYETPQYYTDYVWAASQATSQFKEINGLFTTLVARLSETLFMGGVMIALDPVLIVFALAMAAIRFIVQRKVIKIRFEGRNKSKPVERERDYNKRVFYLADYAKELRLSKIHEVLYGRFTKATDELCDIAEKTGKKMLPYQAGAAFGTEGIVAVSMNLYLAYQVLETKSLTVGDFSALAQSVFRFANRLRQVLNVALSFAEQSLYVDKFVKFMEYEPKIETHKGLIPDKQAKTITLKNVSFTYTGENVPSLRNVSMTIKPHQKVAIVGYNGAGKTTLIKLLMRLYDVSEGEILLGDTNIKEFDTAKYRDEYAAVFQDYQIFAATLGENVVMDDKKPSDDERIIESLNHSNFEDKLAELPLKLETPLTKEFSQSGINLSGGESQKVAIARAFFKNSRVAIMDEPSSALDPIAEYKLNQNMADIAKERTVIFISHRLSTTIMADMIYMFEKGEIIEQGTHRELMDLNGKYAEMFKKQSLNYVV